MVALDLARSVVEHPLVESLRGDATVLPFRDDSFRTVVCAESLEHIPTAMLEQVCAEIVRVVSSCGVIGVRFRPDLRCGRTTCRNPYTHRPPWSHVIASMNNVCSSCCPGLWPMKCSL